MFRHAAYCAGVRAFLTTPAGGGYHAVDFVRVPVELAAGDWRCWHAKGLRYWHLRAYYLPLCWVAGGGAGGAQGAAAEADAAGAPSGGGGHEKCPDSGGGGGGGGGGCGGGGGGDCGGSGAYGDGGDGGVLVQSPSIACRADLCDWMEEGIRRGAAYHQLEGCLEMQTPRSEGEPSSKKPKGE